MTNTLQCGGVRWQLAANVPAHILLSSAGLRLPEWLASGEATLVKQRPSRGIWRVRLPALDFYLKHDHPPGHSWLRDLLRPSAARAEFERAVTLAQRGVPTPEPLAFGESIAGPPFGYVLTRTIPDSTPLDTFLETTLPSLTLHRQTCLRQTIASSLGNLLALLHDAGVTHHDLHPGNLLVQIDAADEIRLWLIDLHAVRSGGPLDRVASYKNLVILNRWFILRSNRSDRLRCWLAYARARRHVEFQSPLRTGWRSPAQELERATQKSNRAFWQNRDRRYLASNRYFRRLSRGGVVGYAVADLPEDALKPFLADPDGPFKDPETKVLKDSPSSTVAELNLRVPGGTHRVIYKRFAVTTWTDPWVSLARPTAATRSWVMGHGLLTRLLPTPRPLAMFHRLRHGMPHEGYLITEKVTDAVDLASYVDRLTQEPSKYQRLMLLSLLNRVGRLLRTLHERHLSHRDLKAPNLLLRVDGDSLTVLDLYFIDLVGVRRHGKLRRARRVQNLARLNASFRTHPGITRTDRLRLLQTYLAGRLSSRMSWKRWWKQIDVATAAKVRRNERSGRPLH